MKNEFPAWRYGPNGQSDIFQSEDDVPAGWTDHPSKAETSAGAESGVRTPIVSPNGDASIQQAATATTAASQTHTDPAVAALTGAPGLTPPNAPTGGAPVTGAAGVEGKTAGVADEKPSDDVLDAHGHPWSAKLHAATKSKTQAGLWRMKVGVSRPAPVKGYPLDL